MGGRGGGMGGGPRGGRRGRGGGMLGRGGGGGGLYVSSSRQREDKRLFEKDYDFEQANTQFEELRVQLAITKISSPGGNAVSNNASSENGDAVEKEKKDEDGTLVAIEDENSSEEQSQFYDKAKSFFDNISCEAVERSQG